MKTDIVVFNLLQIEKILGRQLKSYQAIKEAAQNFLSAEGKSVLITDISFAQDELSQDYWTNGVESFWLSRKFDSSRTIKNSSNTENILSSNILSSAITACLALGYEIKDAVVIGRMHLNQVIRLSQFTQQHAVSFDPDTQWPETEIDLPYLAHHPMNKLPFEFPDCGAEPLGLYPIVDQFMWLEKLLPLGVKTIQLRVKDKHGIELENLIRASIEIAKQYDTRLFINDYWELAIQYGAYGVHLGQEDLNHADINKIRQGGLRLGISTHSYYEVARAHALRPSHLACGPIFTTTSKIMSFGPQGIAQLQRWRRTLNYPLVAIGGISLEKLPAILATKVDGIAMISAITQARDPIAVTKELLMKINRSCS